MGWNVGAVVRAVSKKVPGSVAGLVVGAFCVEFVCFPRIDAGFLSKKLNKKIKTIILLGSGS